MTQWHSLPDLPPRLKSAVLAAAENLAAIAHSEGIELSDSRNEATPHLISILYHLRDGCKAAEKEPQPWVGDQLIYPGEIAAVLETIAQTMMSDAQYELAGRNPSWFRDAALVIERMKFEHCE